MIKETKINQILQKVLPGSVILTNWLAQNDYSYSLQQDYRKNGWLKSIGKGAMIRTGQVMTVTGALHALQFQAMSNIHIGARSALGILGYAHYIEMNSQTVQVFSDRKTHIPAWFVNNKWDKQPIIVKSDFLPPLLGITEVVENGIPVKVSGAARAMMECFELTPKEFDLTEAWELMQSLTTLQPNIVEQLLIECKSIKVKRLFLYMAESAGHAWIKKLNIHRFDLGKGKRSIVENGIFIPKYQITMPSNLIYG